MHEKLARSPVAGVHKPRDKKLAKMSKRSNSHDPSSFKKHSRVNSTPAHSSTRRNSLAKSTSPIREETKVTILESTWFYLLRLFLTMNFLLLLLAPALFLRRLLEFADHLP